jgi:flagellar motor switch protein FliN/FliY
MLCSPALVAGLRAEKGDAPSPVAASEAPDPLPGDGDVHRQLGLLRDVELAVTLCFGARQMLLREVLDLTPGAVVELDRQVSAPVDLLLDGRLLARGEVVVVGGNYGLRVTEIATTQP